MKFSILLLASIFFYCSPMGQRSTIDPNQDPIPFVGTRYFTWTDSSRVDPYYGGLRVINAQIWYPTSLDTSTTNYVRAPYYYKIDQAYKELDDWTEADYQLVHNMNTNGIVNAPLRQDTSSYPLLLFSPSLGGNLSLYTFYAEQLANAGYIVMGINHLFESEYIIKANGEVIANNETFHDSLKMLDIPNEITADEYRLAKSKRIKVLGEDLIFALNQLLNLNASGFNNQIDTYRIGTWGHSVGGAAAIYGSLLDDRIKAVVNLDGTPPSQALEQGLKVPFLFIEDLTDYENHAGYAKMHQRRNDFCQKNQANAYRILIGDSNHNSFLDWGFRRSQNEQGRQAALNFLQFTGKQLLQFFDHHLLQKGWNIEETKSDTLQILIFRPE